jgi:hypothetical protein
VPADPTIRDSADWDASRRKNDLKRDDAVSLTSCPEPSLDYQMPGKARLRLKGRGVRQGLDSVDSLAYQLGHVFYGCRIVDLKASFVERSVRFLVGLALAWVALAAVLLAGNAVLDIVAGPSYHRRELATAEALVSAKVALCRLGTWFVVPGQERELGRALALRQDIREERANQR